MGLENEDVCRNPDVLCDKDICCLKCTKTHCTCPDYCALTDAENQPCQWLNAALV